MERWVIYAFISMLFAGFTAVIAKQGLGWHICGIRCVMDHSFKVCGEEKMI